MSVKVLYFASLKEALGTGSETVELPAGVSTVWGLRDWLAGEGHALLGSDATMCAAGHKESAPVDEGVAARTEDHFCPNETRC